MSSMHLTSRKLQHGWGLLWATRGRRNDRHRCRCNPDNLIVTCKRSPKAVRAIIPTGLRYCCCFLFCWRVHTHICATCTQARARRLSARSHSHPLPWAFSLSCPRSVIKPPSSASASPVVYFSHFLRAAIRLRNALSLLAKQSPWQRHGLQWQQCYSSNRQTFTCSSMFYIYMTQTASDTP